MIQCDLCDGKIKSWTGIQEIREYYQEANIKHLCKECMVELNQAMMKVSRILDDLAKPMKKRAVRTIFRRRGKID